MRFSDFFRKSGNQKLFFKNGQLYKITGDQNNWYNPRYIVSDGKLFDLSSRKDILKIPVPSFNIMDALSGYGSTGMLDYVLRMKASVFFDIGEKELCSALLWKSTELMFANRYCNWRQKDFERIIDWHVHMGMIEEASKAKSYLIEKGFIIVEKQKNTQNAGSDVSNKSKLKRKTDSVPMSTVDKERAIVNMATDEHVHSLVGFPFIWNQSIQKHIEPKSHPFAYMNITGENVHIVKNELQKMNEIILSDIKRYQSIPTLTIPVGELVFRESSEQGHTRFMFSPVTLTGKPSKYPMSLFFTTELHNKRDNTHGEFFYDKNGTISKGHAYFWRKGKGYFLYYKTIDGILTLYKLERSGII